MGKDIFQGNIWQFGVGDELMSAIDKMRKAKCKNKNPLLQVDPEIAEYCERMCASVKGGNSK